MLLRHTPKEVAERSALTINPAKTCQPVGAMYAALGIQGCFPHSHGSQGCCAYHRSALTRHYKEPVMATTSSFTEGSSVFGGQANLLQAINNIFSVYDPRIIAVHTTCLSETIGDDIPQIVSKANDDKFVPAGKFVIHASTPSYVGSHITGYSGMVKGMVDYLATSTGKTSDEITLIPGFVEPADMEEIKRIASLMGIKSIMYPDTSGILNGPMTGKYKMFPKAGATIEEIMRSGDSSGAIGLGEFTALDATNALNSKCKVPAETVGLPIGLAATDRYVDALRKMAGTSVSDELMYERGQLVDIIADMHQYFYGKKVALIGDPDQVIGLTELCVSLDMLPIHIVSGTPGKKFIERIKAITADVPHDINIKNGLQADYFLLHQWIKNEGVDLLIGNTYAKYIARDEDIPYIRHGFPIYDRIGHQYFPTVGYKGALRMVELMLNALLDRKDRDCSEETFELVQ